MSTFTDMKSSSELISERKRRFTANVFQYGGWGGMWTVYIWIITHYDARAGNPAPTELVFGFFVLIFLGMTGTMVRSRMRLAKTITATFEAGLNAAVLALQQTAVTEAERVIMTAVDSEDDGDQAANGNHS